MAVTDNINDTFFDGSYKDVWKKLIPPGISEIECAFIEELAQLQPHDKVLDLMCGYGRHTLPLARKGFLVTAIDNSASYINEITKQATDEGLIIETIESSALSAPFAQTYQAIICMGNSFAFFNREDALQLLRKIASHLSPSGVFVINSWMIAEIALRFFKEREWLSVDRYKYLMHYRFHFNPHRIESEHTVIVDDTHIEVIKGIDYIFTLAELESMFQEAGLKTKVIYSTPKKHLFKLGDNTVYIVVEKNTSI